MSKVIQFKNNQSELEECCPYCELVEDFNDILQDCETQEEFVACLREMVEEASNLGLDEGFKDGFDIGYKVGYKAALETDIEIKQSILDDIQNELDNEVCDCDECNEDCDLD